LVALIDAFRTGSDNALHGTWIEDIDANNITQAELQAFIYDKGFFREVAKTESSRNTEPSALVGEYAPSLHNLIADGVANHAS
jgi:hypothetical protein